MFEIIKAMVLAIAIETGIPPYLALSIALEENQTLNPLAVHINSDGSRDLGVMQLNDSWFKGQWQDPEANIRAGCALIKWLIQQPGITTYWDVAVSYNCGYGRFLKKPPDVSIEYANRVFSRWNVYRCYPN
ncbi:MAG: transglycosylase SLT domain-containing protein [Treponema sp.]|jgi:soluble lytic murein transglycosylase-like protein|nr:transglycosylase SLT domain-containing protein [Treponema sp.]